MDGVLVNSHGAHRTAWRLFLHSLGCDVREADLDFILDGRKRTDILRHFLGDLPAGELELFGRRKDSIFRQMHLRVLPVPGVIALVRKLHRLGIRLAVATSASRSRAESTLAAIGLSDCFAVLATGEEVAQGKPHPAIYLTASRRLELPPANLMAIEDAVSGIQSAVGAGLACMGVASHQDPQTLIEAGAVQVVEDFRAVSFDRLERMLIDHELDHELDRELDREETDREVDGPRS